MNEEEFLQADITRDIEVKKINITSKLVNMGGVLSKAKPSPDNFRGLLKKKFFINEALLQFDSEKPALDLSKGLDVAKDYINTLRTRFGLAKVDPTEMGTLFLG